MKNKKVIVGVFLCSLLMVALISGIMATAIQRRPDIESSDIQDFDTERLTFMTPDGICLDFTESENNLKKILDGFGFEYIIVDSSDFYNYTDTSSRIIVERCIAKISDVETGECTVLNNYIIDNSLSYKNVNGIRYGDYFVTYLIYNPFCNEYNEVIERYDFKILDLEAKSRCLTF